MFLCHQSNHQLLSLLTIRCQCCCRAALQQGGGVLRECLGKIKRPQSAAWAQPLEQVTLHLCPASTTQPLFKAENAPLCYSANPTHPEPLSVLLVGALFILHLYPMCALKSRCLFPSTFLSKMWSRKGIKHIKEFMCNSTSNSNPNALE